MGDPMAGDEQDNNHTVALTREAKAALAAEAKALISQQGEPVTAGAAPSAEPVRDADATEPLSADRRADLQSKAHQLIAAEQVAEARVAEAQSAKAQAEQALAAAAARQAPPEQARTKVAFTSSQVAPVGDDLLPFEAPAGDGFDDMASTEALGQMEDKPPGAAALSSPVPPPAPTASPTQFDIDVATRFKREAAAAEAAASATAGAVAAPPRVALPDPAAAELAVPPTTGLEGVPSTGHAEAFMPKTAVVNMEAELSDGTGMLKVMAGVAVVLVLVVVVFLLLR